MTRLSGMIVGASALLLLAGCGQGGSQESAAGDSGTAQTGTMAGNTSDGGAMEPAASDASPAMEAIAEPVSLADRTYAVEGELAGYYLPNSDIGIGPVMLDHIAIGMAFEFAQYLDGADDAFPPLVVMFEDRSSPSGENELGGTYYEVAHYFEPSHFVVTDATLAFWGRHDVLGQVTFEGVFDTAQVAHMQAGDPHLAETALTGTMTISDQTFENVTFQGWLGD